tara:strand:+ start:1762 stop:3153 length:1392 start_codon:yes stop_codon:yes gene_type:complete
MNIILKNIILSTPLIIGTLSLIKYYIDNGKNKNAVNRKVNFITNKKTNIIYYNDDKNFDKIINFIYKKYSDKINNFSYNEDRVFTYNDWRYKRNKDSVEHIKVKKIIPENFNFKINQKVNNNYYEVSYKLENITDNNNNLTKFQQGYDCCTKDILWKKLTVSCTNKDALLSIIDSYKKEIKEELDKYKKESKETIRIYYFQKDYWNLIAKSPRRDIETVYLKKGEKEKLLKKVEDFYSEETRDIYLSYGIPYKCVHMIHGPPGTGKTSLIKTIASHFDTDVFILPITKDMLDTDLVSAFAYINEQDSNRKIIVIEDIDTLFDDRKEGDQNNGITLQGFLNCLDGFTCIEGTMLFITANKPEVLDYAFIRSCRIDHKLRLDYADKYQIKNMFMRFIPDQENNFNEFYKLISHKDVTTAALQEFLFYNRNQENILEIMDDFYEILDKNDPKNFEILKEENKNFYS